MSKEAGVGAALLQDILEHPDDDTPRMVYADWLGEHGQEARAEFIRVQVELERIPGADPRFPELQRRENQLLEAHPEWRAALQEDCDREGIETQNYNHKSRIVFQRGFPLLEKISYKVARGEPLSTLIEHKAALCAMLEKHAARVNDVDICIWGSADAASLQSLAVSPLRHYLNGISLVIHSGRHVRHGAQAREHDDQPHRLDPEDEATIAALPGFFDSVPALHQLSVRNFIRPQARPSMGGSNEEVFACKNYFARCLLAMIPHMPHRQLHSLDICGGGLLAQRPFSAHDGEVFEAIAKNNWPQLKKLGLTWMDFNGAALNRLLNAGTLKQVKDLSLQGVSLDEDNLHDLGCFGNSANLRNFRVSSPELQGNATWLDLPNYSGLTGLNLWENDRLNTGIVLNLLENKARLPHLQALVINGSEEQFKDRVRAIIASRQPDAQRGV